MQIIEINDLLKEQKEKILPLIYKQKKFEKRKFTFLAMFSSFLISLFIFIINISFFNKIERILTINLKTNYSPILLIFSIIFFIIIFFIFTIILMFNLEYKAKNLNDFYIVTGVVKDIIKRTEYCYDDTYHHYIYLIDNNEKEINTNCYRKFDYENLKKGERYLLARRQDNQIRADITKQFLKI